ncbi:DUF748 domain-containing protein [Desulfoprunum benzoelyticum]|uniref:Uncharacterized protein involved in outer membrane biogenesis n=1 Tax=Desulfoprunum benzoelyticum TaxID=1506996 RepID=A0A840UWZ3_9BACT|nr:DUF748 domain-containing protein [Desulfoprunum benzoelyticum]MBB5347208.1 uncharacterized protein involved in outer membrane biogenesis [Desulfoprunum benzoelyticum]MBM9530466.1 DUF748 domain-containing protein [Desulfoprunum benzoelyticum]
MHPTIRKALTNRYLIIAAVAVLLYALAGFVAAPRILRWYAPGYAARHLDCRAAVDRIAINPFLLTIDVNGFSLQQTDGSPLVSFERLFVDLEASSLFQWAVVLREIALTRPEVHLVAEADGSFNLARLAASPSPTAADKPDTGPLPLILGNAAIRDGRLVVVDRRPSTPAGFTLHNLDFDLQGLATVRDHSGACHLAAVTDEGESIGWEGEIALAPFRSSGRLTLNAVRTASLWQFVRDSVNLEEPEGRIDLATAYRFSAESTPIHLTLEGLDLSVTELALKLPKAEKALFHARKLELEAPRFDSASRELQVTRLLLGGGAIDARINDAGVLNLQQVVRQASSQKTEPQEPPPAAVDRPFTVKANAVDLEDIAITLDDRSRKVPVKAVVAGADLHLQAELAVGGGSTRAVLGRIAGEWRGIRVDRGQSPQPLFAVETLTAEGGECDLGARSFSLERLALRRGGLDVARDGAGNLNWGQLLEPNAKVAKSGKAAPASDPGPAWKYLVKSFEVEGFTAGFTDLTTPAATPVVNLQDFKARLTGIDGRSPMGFTAGFQVAPGGTATISGTVDPAKPAVEAEIEATDVALTSLQPYLQPYVTLQLESALASAKGKLRYGFPGESAKAVFAGNFSLNKLRLTDPAAEKPYLSVDAVRLPKFSLTLQPNGLKAQEIRISRPVGELIIGEDRTLNIARVLKDRPAAGPAPSSAVSAVETRQSQDGDDAFAFDVSRILVDKGDMVFADLSLQPQFRTRIHHLEGVVAGLSSKPDAQARVKLDGQVDRFGIAKINGVIRTDDFRRSSDLNMIFRNLEMQSLSPYSGRFAGRFIKSGKISADLKYKLQDYRMMGENKIVIDNLILGERVDNPDAANLPLDLALALLRDASGRIDIGLPVTGDLNDPRFSFGSLIGKMFANLITKTATAPFQVLAKMFGGKAEKFDMLAFDPGSAELLPPEKEKLIKLAAALGNRPQLKLIVQGRYSPEADGIELRTRSVRRTVAARLGKEIAPEDNVGPLDFSDLDVRELLEELYRERFGPQALEELEEVFAAAKRQPQTSAAAGRKEDPEEGGRPRQAVRWAKELYGRLVDSEAVADADFRRLAEERAQLIVSRLESKGRIAKARIAVKAAEPLPAKAQPSATLALEAL